MTLLDRLKQIRIFRSVIYGVVGLFTYPGLALFNNVEIEGAENLQDLPHKNVLFVSNHQTYFGDVIAFVHIFCAVKWGKFNKLGIRNSTWGNDDNDYEVYEFMDDYISCIEKKNIYCIGIPESGEKMVEMVGMFFKEYPIYRLGTY